MYDVTSVQWSMSINGTEFDIDRYSCVKSIKISEICDGSDTLTFEVQDPDFIFIEDNIFIEDASVYVKMWVEGSTIYKEFSGYISAIDISFPEDGCPVLSIYCLDGSHVMNRLKKKRSWDNATSAEVVQKIAKEYGFSCVVESGYSFTREDTITQSGSTDIEFCEQLAGNEKEKFMCKLIGNTLYYVKMGTLKNEPSCSLYYKESPYDIKSFTPKINKETMQEESEVSDISADTKVEETSKGSTTSDSITGSKVTTTSSVTKNADLTYNPVSRTWNSNSSSSHPAGMYMKREVK